MTEVVEQASRRRTIAVISHPDAGKSTLSEALLLHANKISSAGAVHGKGGRAATVTDWMEMEKARGISITSAGPCSSMHEGSRDQPGGHCVRPTSQTLKKTTTNRRRRRADLGLMLPCPMRRRKGPLERGRR